MHRLITRTPIVVISFFLFIAISFLGVNLAVSQPDGITGCVNKKTGILRIAKTCNSLERQIAWSVFGPQGPQGPTGANGENGVQGVPGNSILSGKGAPTIFIGETGDFFIDLDSYKIYGPKKEQDWGRPRDLIGPKGDAGPQGLTGATGPAGATGPSNTYLDFGSSITTLAGAAPVLCHTSDFELPAGNYTVFASINARGIGFDSQFNAFLQVGDQESERVTGTSIPGSGYGSITLVWSFSSVSANTRVQVWCDSSAALEVSGVSVAAIATGSVSSLP